MAVNEGGNDHFNEERPTMSIDEIFDEYGGGSGEQQHRHDADHLDGAENTNLKVTIH